MHMTPTHIWKVIPVCIYICCQFYAVIVTSTSCIVHVHTRLTRPIEKVKVCAWLQL